MPKVIVFDLDGTLAPSKQPITLEMTELLGQLLEKYTVCVISGGLFARFETQLLHDLLIPPRSLANLHLMPTNGTQYYRFIDGQWQRVYSEDMDLADRETIAGVLEQQAKALNVWEAKTWGPQIEDRGTQVTFSGLGQEAPLDAKKAWDPEGTKRGDLARAVMEELPNFEATVAGETSVDVTRKGVDKAYGLRKLQETLEVMQSEMLFIGDALTPEGNDYPAKAAGYETIAVQDDVECAQVIRNLLANS